MTAQLDSALSELHPLVATVSWCVVSLSLPPCAQCCCRSGTVGLLSPPVLPSQPLVPRPGSQQSTAGGSPSSEPPSDLLERCVARRSWLSRRSTPCPPTRTRLAPDWHDQTAAPGARTPTRIPPPTAGFGALRWQRNVNGLPQAAGRSSTSTAEARQRSEAARPADAAQAPARSSRLQLEIESERRRSPNCDKLVVEREAYAAAVPATDTRSASVVCVRQPKQLVPAVRTRTLRPFLPAQSFSSPHRNGLLI
jgi:hypothetical protein